MRRTGYPVAPLILGAVLGPMAETQFRRAPASSEGDWTIFFSRPLSAAILCLSLIAPVGPMAVRAFRRTRGREPKRAG
ncbi:hypothetical protein [Streptomyces yatensis]|uniref:Uncharacterized protein n=2 Tax=Streptomyces yatensis TaxID=155177 RepID=A0ABP4UX19_9ACTN